MLRLVATDLDGTLLRSDGTISAPTVEVLGTLSARGTHIVLVTGRPVRWLSKVYGQIPLPLPAVCANGAVVYDPVLDEVLRADPLAPDLLADVCARLREAVTDAVFAVEIDHGRQMRHEAEYPIWPEADRATIEQCRSLTDLCAVPAVKLLVRSATHDTDGLLAAVLSVVDTSAEATHSTATGLVEVSAFGVTKAAGLAWLCERLGVTADEVLAFGDMPNDVPMLSWAGQAVCVANAHPAVKEVADEVTLSNDDDGVAAYLLGLG
jgi:Cof subfamily protein (haloacid dehalogenase superfamily)